MGSMEIHEIAEALKDGKARGKTKSGLANALGRQPSMVTELLRGNRQLKASEVRKVREYLELPPAGRQIVRVIGRVGAGAEAHFYSDAQGPFDEVEAPAGSTDSTVAVEVSGDSLGSLFDKTLVFYDDVRRPVTSDLIGKLCVVGLPDGRVLIKKIARSKAGRGLYHLAGQFGDPIMDTPIEWAARVKNMVPR